MTNDPQPSTGQREEPPARYQAYPPWPPDDEISLFDLWDALVRRRWLILGVTALVTILAVGYALGRPDVYRYSQVIEIGERMDEEQLEPIEAPDKVATKLNESHIPAAVRAWAAEHPDAGWRPSLSASTRGDAPIVVVEGEATAARSDAMNTVIARATSALRQDHGNVAAAIREQIELDIERQRNELESLRADIRRVEGRLARVDEREELLRAEIAELEEALASARQRRQAASGDTGDATGALRLMILSNDIQDTRRRLADLRRELRLELPDRRDEHQLRLAELRRRLQGRQASIRAAQARLDNLAQTRVASEPRRSTDPTGTSTRLIAALGLVLGVMLGVFAAFFAEFLAAARRRHEDESSGAEERT